MNDTTESSGPNVLVVDDHRASRAYVVAVARELGARVRQAASARAALAAALSDPPEVICIDLNLGGTSGIDLLQRLCAAWPEGLAWPRVVLLSAEPAPVEGLSCGLVHETLRKPADAGSLRRALGDRSAQAPSAAAQPAAPKRLQRQFREEVRGLMAEVERCLARQRPERAAELLHRLTGCCGWLGDPGLETRSRELLAACRREDGLHSIAQRYYALRADAERWLQASASPR